MTDEDRIEAVTHALIGEFYVGQRVTVRGEPGTIMEFKRPNSVWVKFDRKHPWLLGDTTGWAPLSTQMLDLL